MRDHSEGVFRRRSSGTRLQVSVAISAGGANIVLSPHCSLFITELMRSDFDQNPSLDALMISSGSDSPSSLRPDPAIEIRT